MSPSALRHPSLYINVIFALSDSSIGFLLIGNAAFLVNNNSVKGYLAYVRYEVTI